EISDQAVEAAGTGTEIAGAWTFVCTGIGCNYVKSPGLGRPGLLRSEGLGGRGNTFRPTQIAIRKYGSSNGGNHRRNRHASSECEAEGENYGYLLHDRIPTFRRQIAS